MLTPVSVDGMVSASSSYNQLLGSFLGNSFQLSNLTVEEMCRKDSQIFQRSRGNHLDCIVTFNNLNTLRRYLLIAKGSYWYSHQGYHEYGHLYYIRNHCWRSEGRVAFDLTYDSSLHCYSVISQTIMPSKLSWCRLTSPHVHPRGSIHNIGFHHPVSTFSSHFRPDSPLRHGAAW